MKFRYFLCFFLPVFFFCGISSHAQTSDYQIKGQLEDSFSFSTPYNANVFLLKNNDTAAKSNSDKDGRFQISVRDSGSYKLYIDHPNYHLFVDTAIKIRDKITSLGFIELDLKSKVLDEVIIKDNFTNRINKDTTEFTADSFLIKQFSSAKELLSKIPGVQIDLHGNISYNGKPITELSLDGIPFLNMAPDKLMNLLRGKDINKIQLFDVKSQLARMTGLDDNNRNTGLNLILKEEAKSGYYGKLAGGIGVSKSTQWDNSSNVNSFNDNRRIMVFADMNNTGGSSSIGEMALPQLSTPPQGQPQYLSGGGHYDTRLLKNKRLNLSLDYVFNNMSQELATISNSTNLVPGNEFKALDLSTSKSKAQLNNINITSGYQLSSSSSINLIVSSNINTGSDQSQSQSSSNSLDGRLLNSSETQTNSSSHSPNTLANIVFQKTFTKPERSFNLSLTSNFSNSKSDGTQVSNSKFSTSTLDEAIRQNKRNEQNASNYTFNLHYTEPLTKGLNLNFDFIANSSHSLSNNNTYDIYEDGVNLTDSLNPLYSNNFKSRNLQTKINTALQYQHKKTFFSLGGNISQLNWNQYDITNHNSIEKKYLNILPFATFRYNMNTSSVVSLDLRSQTTQPQLSQIQPITNNSDPLHILMGNPDLTQSTIYSLALNYSSSKPSVNRYFNTYATFSLTQNAISLKQYYNNDGKEISQYINTNGNYSGNILANYNRKLSTKMQAIFSESISLFKSKNILNNEENNSLEQHYTSSANLIYAIDTLLSINYTFTYNYSISHSSVLDNSTSKIWNVFQNLDITYSLPMGFSILSRFNWNLRPKISTQDMASNIFLWNFSITKTLGKKEAFTTKLFVYDVLNQNKSNSVYYGANIQSERTSNTIGRYAMLGVVWNFTKRKQTKD